MVRCILEGVVLQKLVIHLFEAFPALTLGFNFCFFHCDREFFSQFYLCRREGSCRAIDESLPLVILFDVDGLRLRTCALAFRDDRFPNLDLVFGRNALRFAQRLSEKSR